MENGREATRKTAAAKTAGVHATKVKPPPVYAATPKEHRSLAKTAMVQTAPIAVATVKAASQARLLPVAMKFRLQWLVRPARLQATRAKAAPMQSAKHPQLHDLARCACNVTMRQLTNRLAGYDHETVASRRRITQCMVGQVIGSSKYHSTDQES